MRTLLVFLLLFHTFAYALNDLEILERAKRGLKSPSKEILYRSYNDYKNLYSRALMDENSNLKKKALIGLVEAGHKLKLNVKRYEKELNRYGYKKKVVIKNKPSKQSQNSLAKVKQVAFLDNKLHIRFDKKLGKKDVNYFKIFNRNTKVNRYVFDIHAVLPKSFNIKHKRIAKIKIGQNNKTTSRFVFEDKEKFNLKFVAKSNELVINFGFKYQKPKTKRAPVSNTFVEHSYAPKTVVFSFDKRLQKREVNFFKKYDREKKINRYIFEVNAKANRKQEVRHKRIRSIQVTPVNTKRMRIVMENRRKLNLRFTIKNNTLRIYTGLHSGYGSKSVKAVTKGPVRSTIIPTNYTRGQTVVIDAGHGGKDGGAVGYKGAKEKDVTLAIAKKLQRILKSRGYRVYMTRTRDSYLKLRRRTAYANKKKAKLFISIHANAVPKRNASKARGFETYFLDQARSARAKRVAAKENPKDLENMSYFGKNSYLSFLNRNKIIASNKLALDIQRSTLGNMRKSFKVKDSGVRAGPFWVLVGAEMPAVLIEVGFITHPIEGKRLTQAKYQKEMAQGIANGVDIYFSKNI